MAILSTMMARNLAHQRMGFRLAATAYQGAGVRRISNRMEKQQQQQQYLKALPVLVGIGIGTGIFLYSRDRRQRLDLSAEEERKFSAASALGGFFGGGNKKKPLSSSLPPAGERVQGLPEYSMAQVNANDSAEKEGGRVWVTYRNGVYDITEFIPKHPGARNIEMAAGGSVEPFWEMYAVHKDNAEVYELLEKYRIGNLKEEDAAEVAAKSSEGGLFANEPRRHKALQEVSKTPYNAETPLPILADKFNTPNDLFYVRNHLPTPDLKADDYELEVQVSGPGEDGKVFKLDDIKKFPKYTVTAAIQCGGNRRAEMVERKPLKGLPWSGGAIGNATWSGARLCDVLKAAGFAPSEEEDRAPKELHVQMEGADCGADGSPYGASVPARRAVDPRADVLLAYEMNGEALPRDHGFPVRAVVPGVVGARNVKWLTRVIVAEEESQSHWQQSDYKGFSPSVDWDNVDWSSSPAIQAMPVTSAICSPPNGGAVKKGAKTTEVRGYAWSGGGNRIIRVDVTADGGRTWRAAEIIEQDAAREPRHYGWTLWKAEVEVPKGEKEMEVWSKAVDSNYNVQPETFENIWNLRGLLSNAYFRAKYKIQ